jgi:hypothetical protein
MTDKQSKKNGPGKKLKGEPLKNSIKSTLKKKPTRHSFISEKIGSKPSSTDSLAVHMYRQDSRTAVGDLAQAVEKKHGKLDLKKYNPANGHKNHNFFKSMKEYGTN